VRNHRLFRKIDGYRRSAHVKRDGIYPYFRANLFGQGADVLLRGNRSVLMLGSNSYLGLTDHPEVKAAAAAAIRKYGTGCSGSRFLNGTLDIHEELEAKLAEWVGKDAALLFSTGYQTNLGLLATVLGRHDHVILDSEDHASIIDGARLSTAVTHRYAHNDMNRLAETLSRLPGDSGKLIVTDGVFSMTGDIVKLPDLLRLAEAHGAAVLVDDAHALGVIGRDGSGTSSHFGLTERVDLIMGTFSKSLASSGGFVAADAQTIEYLKHHARSLMFSASMPPPCVAAALAALAVIRSEPDRIRTLWHNSDTMRGGLRSLGYNTGMSETPIIPVYVGDMTTLFRMCKALEEEGVFVNPVVPPAVPPGGGLLRISVMATHTADQIAFALEKMAKTGKALGVI
jgi:8-amino-7-oxononanoate synthase